MAKQDAPEIGEQEVDIHHPRKSQCLTCIPFLLVADKNNASIRADSI